MPLLAALSKMGISYINIGNDELRQWEHRLAYKYIAKA
jgi:hypothetical protein